MWQIVANCGNGTRTPPRDQDPSGKPTKSSPVGKVSKNFLPEIREPYQKFRHDDRFLLGVFDQPEFLQFLKVKPPKSVLGGHLRAQGSFLELANIVAKSIKDKHFPEGGTLVFRDMEKKSPPGHVTDTKCRPDITAALQSHWEGDVVRWPFIRLAGEKASSEKTPDIQKGQAISYLHYLLLARPDLYVAQGLLSSKEKVIFLFGIGGQGVWEFHAKWENKDFNKLLYAFIYRLYNPGNFADSSYIKTEFHENTSARYTININYEGATKECRDFYPIYARNPFATRTHVLSNPNFELEVGSLTILKDQLCRVERRFTELTILKKYVHKPDPVPGVVMAAYGEKIKPPLPKERRKYRLGLEESGSPFASIPTLSQVLETLFDLLEVLRYLRLHRKVLHRDISSGNVLYVENSSNHSPPLKTVPVPPAQEAKTNALPLCFAKYLLGESDNPWKTSMLLVDFNLAEHLDPRMNNKKRIHRTGTPIFIARAVEQGRPMPPVLAFVPGIPESPNVYTEAHPDRVENFLSSTETLFNPKRISVNRPKGVFRHELNHDAESVFWLLLYWAMVVQPENCPKQKIDMGSWGYLNGNHASRAKLVRSVIEERTDNVEAFTVDVEEFTDDIEESTDDIEEITDNIEESTDDIEEITDNIEEITESPIHSYYKPLQPLIKDLAAILVVDSYWLPASDHRRDPFYITEAFQRLILKFIIDNRGAEFMGHRVEKTFRKVQEGQDSHASSTSHLQSLDALNRMDMDDVEMGDTVDTDGTIYTDVTVDPDGTVDTDDTVEMDDSQ